MWRALIHELPVAIAAATARAWMRFRWRETGICLLALPLMGLLASEASSQSRSYWLERGGTNVYTCPGETQGKDMKAASLSEGWVQLVGVIVCKDAGANYSYEIDFLSTEINPSRRDAIGRDTLNFDFIALTVYRPRDGGAKIEWLYDEAHRIQGQLSKSSTRKIYFGKLKFDVPKEKIAQATNLVFYLTAEGVVFHFGLL